jgi:hypothetical protein
MLCYKDDYFSIGVVPPQHSCALLFLLLAINTFKRLDNKYIIAPNWNLNVHDYHNHFCLLKDQR